MDLKTDLARGLGESLVHLVFFGRIPLARDAAGVGGELADVFKETSAEVFNVGGEFSHEAGPLPVGFGWSEWSRDRLDWIDCSSLPLEGPELMKGSAEREAKQLPMTNPAGSRSTDCKVQKTSGIPKNAGGGDPRRPG